MDDVYLRINMQVRWGKEHPEKQADQQAKTDGGEAVT